VQVGRQVGGSKHCESCMYRESGMQLPRLALCGWLSGLSLLATVCSLCRAEDRVFGASWKALHHRHANLRLLCEACLLEENSRRSIRTGRGPGRSGARSGRSFGRTGRGGRGRGRS
jgi:hypothetical protein